LNRRSDKGRRNVEQVFSRGTSQEESPEGPTRGHTFPKSEGGNVKKRGAALRKRQPGALRGKKNGEKHRKKKGPFHRKRGEKKKRKLGTGA